MLAREGWDPEQLAENFAAEVRQVFLLQVAPDVADAVDADRERLVKWGEVLGLARSVRILETVGRAIREMKSAPEKIVMLEVAMVRLTKPELDHSFESLDERLTRLERGASAAPVPATAPPARALRPIGSSVAATGTRAGGFHADCDPDSPHAPSAADPAPHARGRGGRRATFAVTGGRSRALCRTSGASHLAIGATTSAIGDDRIGRGPAHHHRRAE